MAALAGDQAGRVSFWAKMTIGISAFIVLGFAQFALRGFVPYAIVPVVFHIHGAAMLAWLGLLVGQSLLAGGRGGLAIHRRLGWASAVMLPAIVILASLTCLTALQAGLQPPFFTPAYFLALVHVGIAIFAGIVVAAIALRGQADWHKRLMVGSAVLLMEPALGRVLPMPFIMPWGGWLQLGIQLGVIGLVMRHDRRLLGRIHPATSTVAMAVMLHHVTVELLALSPRWIAFADGISA